jgi:GT2 family glycosyltransferase
MKDIHLSISIVIYELDETMLRQCLNALEAALIPCLLTKRLSNWSLTIIDNGNNGELLLPFHSDNTDVIENAENVGYGAAHNQSIMSETSDFHLILNPDVILDPEYFSQTLGFMSSQSDVVLAGPKGMTENGSNAYLCKRYPSLAVLLARGLNRGRVSTLFSQHLARYEYHDLPELSFSDVELLSGCCMFASTNALQRAGGFDDHFFLYFEDFDLSLRMKAEGRVVFLPASSIVHLGGNSATKGLHHIRLFVQSGLRFFRKHGWKII